MFWHTYKHKSRSDERDTDVPTVAVGLGSVQGGELEKYEGRDVEGE